jgi:hypothetical protein
MWGLRPSTVSKPHLTRLIVVNKSLWPLSLLTILIALLAFATGMSMVCYLGNSPWFANGFIWYFSGRNLDVRTFGSLSLLPLYASWRIQIGHPVTSTSYRVSMLIQHFSRHLPKPESSICSGFTKFGLQCPLQRICLLRSLWYTPLKRQRLTMHRTCNCRIMSSQCSSRRYRTRRGVQNIMSYTLSTGIVTSVFALSVIVLVRFYIPHGLVRGGR